MKSAIFNWSGGKDSTLALHLILQEQKYAVKRLVTSVNSEFNRISMHGVREELLKQQASSIGIDLHQIKLPAQPTMDEYNAIMEREIDQLKLLGVTHSVFGDIFLEDLKNYREKQLSKVNIEAVFPLWKKDTTETLNQFIDLGYKTILVSTNANLLPKEFCGRVIDHDFIKDLPKNVDPCGENGEFHTFVFDGPIFSKPIDFTIGDVILREYETPKSNDDCTSTQGETNKIGFYFCDLIP